MPPRQAKKTMDDEPEERTLRIHQLDHTYQSNLHEMELIGRDEDKRRLKLQLLALRDENSLLEDTVQKKDSQYGRLAEKHESVQAQLENMRDSSRSQDAKLKMQAIELNRLQAEVSSMGNSMEDSTKALQEKFALSRELDKLRPELEHLKSQLENHQEVVAEKHSLQRQLDTLEVELENEKTSKAKAQNKEDKAAMSDLKARLEEAEKALASTNKSHQRELGEANAHSEALAERLTGMKAKLKATQAELKETHAELGKYREELEKAQEAAIRISRDEPKKKPGLKPQASRKRAADESSFGDITIATPGNEGPADRRPMKKKGAVGEKSAFSITPFLNKSKSLADDDSPEAPTPHISGIGQPRRSSKLREESVVEDEPAEAPEPEEPEEPEEEPEEMAPPPKPKAAAASKGQKPRGRPKAKATAEAPAVKKAIAAPAAKEPSLEPEPEPEPEASPEPEKVPTPKAASKTLKTTKANRPQLKGKPIATSRGPLVGSSLAALSAEEGKKKKRKLLGGASQTLLDEDDGEDVPIARPVKVQPGAKRQLGKSHLGGVQAEAFGKTFSPLKRDRRGVHASFLA